jgi:crotonobetainyl-CoA:carnitine CoA-transferase CaiB-like acyl-CoA transferase
LGQHSAQVLTQVLGLTDAQIGRLVQTGVVVAA